MVLQMPMVLDICMSCRLQRSASLMVKISALEEVSSCWSLSSTLLVLLWMSRYRCAPEISLVNEVLVGLEWRGLIGQHTPAAHSQRLRAEMG